MSDEIKYPGRFKQRIYFKGARNKANKGFTDLDVFQEIGNKMFTFIEAYKEGVDKEELGQILAMQRVCDCIRDAGKHAMLIKATHNVPVDEPVYLTETRVSEFYYDGEWRTIDTMPFTDVIDTYHFWIFGRPFYE